MPHVARAPALLDLRQPALAVWAGEVVVVAAPDPNELASLLALARAEPRLRVAEPTSLWGVVRIAHAVNPAGPAGRRAGVVVGLAAAPTPPARRALAALRLTIARRMPCRCVWLVGGRVYPE